MHLPRRWSSSKSNRVSFIPVQTGFPASLLDLFLKNHHRFTSSIIINNNDDNDNQLIVDCNTINVVDDKMMIDKPDTETIPLPSSSSSIEMDVVRVKSAPDANDEDRLNSRGVMDVALKVFIVVALAFGTKRLAFGITVSAILLLVLEYVGRYATCSRAQFVFESVLHRFMLLLPQKSVLISGSVTLSKSLEIESRLKYCRTTQAEFESVVEAVEPKVDGKRVGDSDRISGCVDEQKFSIRNVMDEKMTSGCVDEQKLTIRNVMDEKMNSREEEGLKVGGIVEASGINKRRSLGAKLKSKIIHKLVPKKLRRSKKDSKCKGSEAKFEDRCTSVKGGDSRQEENVSVTSELVTESEEHNSSRFQFQLGDDDMNRGDLDGSSHHSSNHAIGKEEHCDTFGSGHPNELVNTSGLQNKLVPSNIQMDARGKSGYVMLVLIVLAGLVGGRILSFLFAVSYFCILKSIGTLRRKDSRMPNVASPVQR